MASRRKPSSSDASGLRLGVPGLDELLAGALAPGASVALSGPSQSGKTWLAMQFLLAGAASGDALLYAKVSARKEARETLPLAAQWDELVRAGRATQLGERLNRPITTWLSGWLDRFGRDARVVIEGEVERARAVSARGFLD